MNTFSLVILCIILVTNSCSTQKKIPADFLPKGYIVAQTYDGDLNNDGEEDRVLLIKGTNAENIVINRFDKKVDRNRRGILILLKNSDGYMFGIKNEACFLSENEDGGSYYQPQLSLDIKNGDLHIAYRHGKYGYWEYTFRHNNSHFELIGYKRTNGGVVIHSEERINFLTKKRLISENINEEAEGGDEVFKDTWEEVKINSLLKLSEIKDFSELEVTIN